MIFREFIAASKPLIRFCSLSLPVTTGRWGVGVIAATLLMMPNTAHGEMTFQTGISATQYSQKPAPQTEKGVVGINLEIQDDRYPVIMEVYPGTPAAKSGLRTGDNIVSVDMMDVYGLSRTAVDNAISDVPGHVVKFLVQRDGRAFYVSLTVASLGKIVQSDVKSLYRQEFGPSASSE